MSDSLTELKFQGQRGQVMLSIGAESDLELPTYRRRFSAGKFKRSSRFIMATQETVQESSVRRKTHPKKSVPSKLGKTVLTNAGDKLRYSKDNISLKNQISLSGGMSNILTAALKTAVAADMQENMMKSNYDRKSSRKSKRPLFGDPMILMQSVKHHRNFLSTLEATAVIAVFDKIIDELAVLKSLLPECSVKEVLPEYQNIEERFGKEESASSPNMDEKPKNEDLEKLQRDRAFIEEVLLRTSKEMEMENSFWSLFLIVVNTHKMERDEEELVARWPVVRKRLRELRGELRQATEMLGPQALSRALVSLRQQDEWGDTLMLLAAEDRYVDNWEAARRAQQATRNNIQERGLKQSIDHATLRVTIETRAAHQAKFMMMEEESRLEHELYLWERRRLADLEQMGDTLIKARNTLEAARVHTEDMRKEVAKRSAELEIWRAKHAELQCWDDAARCIQKCWRAHAYRRTVALAIASMRRGRLQVLADLEEAATTGRASVRTRIRLQKDRELREREAYERAFLAMQALLGMPEARQVLVKEALATQKGKKGKGGKGRK